jgi:hypothetical protein
MRIIPSARRALRARGDRVNHDEGEFKAHSYRKCLSAFCTNARFGSRIALRLFIDPVIGAQAIPPERAAIKNLFIRNPLDRSGVSYSFAAKIDADQGFLRRSFPPSAKRSRGNRIKAQRPRISLFEAVPFTRTSARFARRRSNIWRRWESPRPRRSVRSA